MGKQRRLKQQRFIANADKVDSIARLLDNVKRDEHRPAKALPKMTQDALQVASQTIDAQALLIAGYQRELERLQPIPALLLTLLECQTIEQVHTTIQQALDSGLLPTGDKPHEQ